MQRGQLILEAGSYLFFGGVLSFYDSPLLRITISTALLMVQIEAKWVLGQLFF